MLRTTVCCCGEMASAMAKATSTAGLLRSLRSLMPISITLVSCSAAFTLPSAAAAAASSSAATEGGRGSQAGRRSAPTSSNGGGLGAHHRVSSPSLSTRGGAVEGSVGTSVQECGVHRHSFRSTVRTAAVLMRERTSRKCSRTPMNTYPKSKNI